MIVKAQVLTMVARDSSERDYNQLMVDDYKADPAKEYDISPILLHHYSAGVPCCPHIRCVVKENGKPIAMLDVSMRAAADLLVWDVDNVANKLMANNATDNDYDYSRRLLAGLRDAGVSMEVLNDAMTKAHPPEPVQV